MDIFTIAQFKRYLFYILLVACLGAVLPSCKSSKKSKRKKSYSGSITTKPRPMTSSGGNSNSEGGAENAGSGASSSSGSSPSSGSGTSTSTGSNATAKLAKVEKVLSTADSYMGTKHKMGGQSTSGIDCSGLVQVSYKSINIDLPRSTTTQVNSGKSVKMSEVIKGDLLFFTYPGGKRVTHVGIVCEVNGSSDVVFIHTSSSRGVRKDNLHSDYWKPLFIDARRIL